MPYLLDYDDRCYLLIKYSSFLYTCFRYLFLLLYYTISTTLSLLVIWSTVIFLGKSILYILRLMQKDTGNSQNNDLLKRQETATCTFQLRIVSVALGSSGLFFVTRSRSKATSFFVLQTFLIFLSSIRILLR